MKEITNIISSWADGMDRRWKQLPPKESRRIVLYGFAGYAVISLAIIIQVVHQVSNSRSTIEIEHISNPVAKVKAVKNFDKPKTADDERE